MASVCESNTNFKVGISTIEAVQGKYIVTAEEWAHKLEDEMKEYIKENGHDADVQELFEWNLRLIKNTGIKTRHSQYDLAAIHKECGYKPHRKMLEKLANDGLNELLLRASKKCIMKWQELSSETKRIENITHVITHTATAWQVPSIAHILIHELNLSSATRAIPLNGSGCQGAQTVFYTAKAIINQEPNAVVLCCVGDIFSPSVPTVFQYKSVEQLKNREAWICLNLMSDGAVSYILENMDINDCDNIGKYYIDKMGSFILPKSVWHYDNIAVTKELTDGPSSVAFVGRELVSKMILAFGTYFKGWYCDAMRINEVENNKAIIEALNNTVVAMHAGGKLVFNALEKVLKEDVKLKQDDIDALLKYSIDRYKSSGNFGCASFVHALYDIVNDKKNSKDIFCLAFGAGVSYQYSSLKQITKHNVGRKNVMNAKSPQSDASLYKISILFASILIVMIAALYGMYQKSEMIY